MKKSLPAAAIRRSGLALLLLLVSAILTLTGILGNIDRLFYDQYIRYSKLPPAEDIVIVAIDQRSLEKLGRWPWPRRLHAELLEKLTPFQPKGVALDIVFAEPDNRAPGDDYLLAKAIAENGSVVLPVLLEQASQSSNLQETLPLEKIRVAAAGLGHVDTEIDSDGITRSVYLKAGLGKPRWPFFALSLLEVTGDWTAESALPGERNPSPPADDSYWVRDYHVFVPFSGPDGSFQHVSFVDVLSGKIPPRQFKGKYILVGATATGLGDTIPTPVSAQSRPMSGVEFNANVLNGLLQESLIVALPSGLELFINLFVVLICVLPFMVFGARRSSLWGAVLIILVTILSYVALSRLHTWFPPATALFIILLGNVLIYRYSLRRLIRSLFKERQRSQTVITSIAEAVIRTDYLGRILKINRAAEQFSIVSAAHAIGKPIWEVLQLHSRHDDKPFPLQMCIEEAVQRRPSPLVLSNRQGKKILVQLVITPVPSAHKDQQELVVVLTDISEADRLSKQIAYHETHHCLTGLPSSTLINEKLRSAIKREAQSTERILVIIGIDIDRFSSINESLGNTAGDLLLQEMAKRLMSFQYDGETVAGHINGDEFVLILGNVLDRAALMPLLASVRKTLGRSVTLLDRRIAPTFAMGVSIFPEDSLEPEILLRQANTAMQRAKEKGLGKTQLFTKNMQARADRRFKIEHLLQQAVEKQYLITLYQPLIKTDTLQIVGVEALMRLRDEEGKFFYPDEFIPIAEESNLIVEMGYHQLSQACHQLVTWQKQTISPLRLTFNLSPSQLRAPDLFATVEQILSTSKLSPNLLEFEVTQNIFLEEAMEIRLVIEQLRMLGTGFAIDNFGTGYSSMNYLTRFPFSRLTIDKSLIQDLLLTSGSRAVTSAIINMVHSLDMVVIAEGIEKPSQHKILLDQGCDEVQGYIYGQPMLPDQFYSYYTDGNGIASI